MRLARRFGRRQRRRKPLPVLSRFEPRFAQHIVLAALDPNNQRRVAAGIERQVELLAALYGHLAKRTGIAHSGIWRKRLDAQIRRRVFPQRLRVLQRETPHCAAPAVGRPAGHAKVHRSLQAFREPVVAWCRAELEAPVPDKFRIEAPVHGKRDILKKCAPQRRGNFVSWLRRRDFHPYRFRIRSRNKGDQCGNTCQMFHLTSFCDSKFFMYGAHAASLRSISSISRGERIDSSTIHFLPLLSPFGGRLRV